MVVDEKLIAHLKKELKTDDKNELRARLEYLRVKSKGQDKVILNEILNDW